MIKFISLFVILTLLNSCSGNFKESFTINDFSTNQKLTSKFELSSGNSVDKVRIHIKGSIDDTVKIGRYKLNPNKIDTTFSHEWYANEYSILFDPYKATDGDLVITFEFIVY